MTEVVDELLDISRLDAGNVALQRSAFALDDLVRELVRTRLLLAQSKGLPIRVDAVRAIVHNDRTLLARVVPEPAGQRHPLHRTRRGARARASGGLACRAGDRGLRDRHCTRRTGAHLRRVLPGGHAQGAADGPAALACVATGFRPDAALADLRLPGGASGVAAVEALRAALSTDVPALVVTGDVGSERARLARAQGYTVLANPVKAMPLRAFLGKAFAAA